MTIEQVYKKRDEILRIAAAHGVRNIRIFGSVARGDANPGSDIDLLVEIGPTTSSWFPTGLILDLEELLGRPVEVVTEKGLSPSMIWSTSIVSCSAKCGGPVSTVEPHLCNALQTSWAMYAVSPAMYQQLVGQCIRRSV